LRRSLIAVLLEQFKKVKESAKQLQTTGRNDNSAEEEENVSSFLHLSYNAASYRFLVIVQVDLDCEMSVLAAGISIGLVVLGNGGPDIRYTALQTQLR
jgi:hypothetical protein